MSQSAQPRIRSSDDQIVPRVVLRAMFALVVTTLVLVSAASLTDRPLEATPSVAPVIAERTIFLSGDMSGAARVLDGNGTLIADLSPEQGGFISGVRRVLVRERAKHGADQNGPVLLQLRTGNRLSVYDPSTGWSAELMGFGASNSRAFARLLDKP